MNQINPSAQKSADYFNKQVIEKKRNNKLLTMRVRRVVNGVEFFFKSEIIENFMKQAGKVRESESMSWDNKFPYNNALASKVSYDLFDHWGYEALMIRADKPNLAFLRSVGLGDGVTFSLDMIASDKELDTYAKQVNEKVVDIYRSYIKPIDIKSEIVINNERRL